MSLRLTTAAANPPVTTAEAKAHLRVTSSSDDTYIENLVLAATELFESMTGRALVNQTWTRKLDGFPGGRVIRLEKNPVSSVTSVTYNDQNGDSQTFSSSKYTVDTDSIPARVVLNEGESWPSTDNAPNTVTILYISGYGADESSVPEKYRQAILLLVSHWYRNREAVSTGPGGALEIPIGFERITKQARVWGSEL